MTTRELMEAATALRLRLLDNGYRCSVEGCEREPKAARGMCWRHYFRWKRHGDPLGGKPTHTGEPLDWLRATFATDTDDCQLWPFARRGPTGVIRYKGRAVSASRLVLTWATGRDEPKMECAHSCVQAGHCCNKRHLRWATHAENMADMVAHGTTTGGVKRPYVQGEANANHKLTAQEVVDIRRLEGVHSARALGRLFGVTHSTVRKIQLGKAWECTL